MNTLLRISQSVSHEIICSSQVRVKFYCDIRLAFVKKDHQLVYRYNTENKIIKKLNRKDISLDESNLSHSSN